MGMPGESIKGNAGDLPVGLQIFAKTWFDVQGMLHPGMAWATLGTAVAPVSWVWQCHDIIGLYRPCSEQLERLHGAAYPHFFAEHTVWHMYV
jgi:hypothetical protein